MWRLGFSLGSDSVPRNHEFASKFAPFQASQGSQIFGTDPELTYRWNRLRLVQTFMRLQAEGVVNLKPIISHVVPFADAGEAFRILDQEPEIALQVILDCMDM